MGFLRGGGALFEGVGFRMGGVRPAHGMVFYAGDPPNANLADKFGTEELCDQS